LSLSLSAKGISIAIVLSTLALSALFLARGTTSLVAGMLFPVEAAPAGAAKTGKPQKPPGTDPPNILAILKRNAFDPSTGPLPKPAPPPDELAGAGEPVVEEDPNQLPPACDTTVKLIAAVHSEQHPEWSFATLGTGSTPPLLYREGSKITDREVVSIYPRAVYMRQGNGKLCSLTLFVDPNAVAKAPPAAVAPVAPAEAAVAAAAPPTGGASNEAELDANITKQSETQYTVQRSFVDKLLSDQASIMRAARIVPHEENGAVVGVKLYGIRRNSLLGKLGIQNGDLLKTINGADVSSPDSALEAYAKFRSATNLSVAVTRRGQEMTLGYDIAGGDSK
jgi:general secretion pathway protein C